VGAADRAASWILLKPYRCLDCNKRFHSFTPRADSTTTRRRLQKLRRSKSTRRELAMYAIASVILAAIIYFAVQQRIGSGG
jgi:hypothetical protein